MVINSEPPLQEDRMPAIRVSRSWCQIYSILRKILVIQSLSVLINVFIVTLLHIVYWCLIRSRLSLC